MAICTCLCRKLDGMLALGWHRLVPCLCIILSPSLVPHSCSLCYSQSVPVPIYTARFLNKFYLFHFSESPVPKVPRRSSCSARSGCKYSISNVSVEYMKAAFLFFAFDSTSTKITSTASHYYTSRKSVYDSDASPISSLSLSRTRHLPPSLSPFPLVSIPSSINPRTSHHSPPNSDRPPASSHQPPSLSPLPHQHRHSNLKVKGRVYRPLGVYRVRSAIVRTCSMHFLHDHHHFHSHR